jgi:hypothetical protein
MEIERTFGDVDPNKRNNRVVHGVIPVLQMRARALLDACPALAAVRTTSKRPATIPLRDGL